MTTSFLTTHCGCTEQPIPTISFTTTTITCPAGWPITTPFVVTMPVQLEPTGHGHGDIVTIDRGHEVIVTTDSSGKTITITGPIDPTKTVVVPVTVIPLPPSGTLSPNIPSPSSLSQGHSNGPDGSAPHGFPSAPGASDSGSNSDGGSQYDYQPNGGSTVNNGDSTSGNGHGGTSGGDSASSGNNGDSNNGHGGIGSGGSSSPGSNNAGSSNGIDSTSNGHDNQRPAAPSSSTWIESYTGAAAAAVATSSTLLMALAIISFIFLELSVI